MKTVFAVCCLLSVCSEFQAARAFTPFSYFSRLGSNRPSRAEAAYLRRGGDAAAAGGDDVGAEAVKRGVRFPWEWSGPMNGVAWDGGKTKSAFEYLGPRLRKSDKPDLPTFPELSDAYQFSIMKSNQSIDVKIDPVPPDECSSRAPISDHIRRSVMSHVHDYSSRT
ncbi:Hypp3938 [Branchiostoma lanceolatum]|uniref:Hypp3938 protein n=1 Tax=Branchiostoma lanceolatum TaxID=7740 RepID=A0A8K0EWG9_BRALA|nr:Hypp3938 [Branchiostoma lanceolatum]